MRLAALIGAISIVVFFGLLQLYPPVGWVDPGLYISAFLGPSHPLPVSVNDYHTERVGFVLPGTLLYAFFAATTAHAILVTLFYAISLAAIYSMTAHTLKTENARWTILLAFAFSPLWIVAFSRGYVDGPAISLSLASIAPLMRNSVSKMNRGVSGALIAGAFSIHPYAGGIAGATAVLMVLVHSASRKDFALGLRDQAIGASAMLISLFAMAWAAGLQPPLFGNSFLAIAKAILGSGQRYEIGFAEWIGDATRLAVLPLILACVLAAKFVEKERKLSDAHDNLRQRPNLENALNAAWLTPLAMILIAACVTTSFLQFSFYSSYLFLSFVPAFILGARRMEALDSKSFKLILPIVGGIGLASIALGQQFTFETREHFFDPSVIWIVITLFSALAIFISRSKKALWFIPVIALVFGISGVTNRDTETVFNLDDAPDLMRRHAILEKMHNWLSEQDPQTDDILIWYNRDDFSTEQNLAGRELYGLTFEGEQIQLNMLDSLTASLGWQSKSLGFAMPVIDHPYLMIRLTGPSPALRLISFCPDIAACTHGLDELRERGVLVNEVVDIQFDVQLPRDLTIMSAVLTPNTGPSFELLLRTAKIRFESGPRGDLFHSGALYIDRLRDINCAGENDFAECSFTSILSDSDAARFTIAFARKGLIWEPM